MKFYWQTWEETDLLQLRLCDLNLSLEGSRVQDAIEEVTGELRSKGVDFSPKVWISDDWFCPDGVAGFAVPFYLFHPRLMALQRKYLGEAEGASWPSLLKLVRHELGHVVDNAFGLRKFAGRGEFFGSPKQHYPQSYRPRPFSRQYVQHLGSGYGQSHPDEDFAETFAVWLNSKSRWQTKYRNHPAMYKLEYMDELMGELKYRDQVVFSRRPISNISVMKTPLGEYFRKCRSQRRLNPPKNFDQDLKKVFSTSASGDSAARVIKQMRPKLRNKVSHSLGVHSYRVDPVIEFTVQRAREIDLRSPRQESKFESRLTQFLLSKTEEFLNSGRDRIIL